MAAVTDQHAPGAPLSSATATLTGEPNQELQPGQQAPVDSDANNTAPGTSKVAVCAEERRGLANFKTVNLASNTALIGLGRLKLLDQLLALWILLAMAVGIIIGRFSDASEVLEKVKFVDVSLPLAIALCLMMYPILCRVDLTEIGILFKRKSLLIDLGVSLFINWIFAPLLMLGLAWAFLPDKQELRDGLILVGIARCIAMVLVWTDIAGGDINCKWLYCAVLVAVNSVLQIVLYSPLAILFIDVMGPSRLESSGVNFSYDTVARSVAAFLGIPLGAALLTRGLFYAFKKQEFFHKTFLPLIGPLSLISLLFTTLIIFAAQGKQVVKSITDVLRVIAPLLVYFLIMFFLVLWLCYKSKMSYGRSASQTFTGASNNFELAIAVAVASYGADSPQALAATVGPLVEVPVLVTLAYLMVWWRKKQRWDVDEAGRPCSATASSGRSSNAETKTGDFV
ncbi:arsenicals resistance [Microbotryomycetes sp. JL201]|nr:arsenicals resistance [Microbotryomycetes sp. JL201]